MQQASTTKATPKRKASDPTNTIFENLASSEIKPILKKPSPKPELPKKVIPNIPEIKKPTVTFDSLRQLDEDLAKELSSESSSESSSSDSDSDNDDDPLKSDDDSLPKEKQVQIPIIDQEVKQTPQRKKQKKRSESEPYEGLETWSILNDQGFIRIVYLTLHGRKPYVIMKDIFKHAGIHNANTSEYESKKKYIKIDTKNGLVLPVDDVIGLLLRARETEGSKEVLEILKANFKDQYEAVAQSESNADRNKKRKPVKNETNGSTPKKKKPSETASSDPLTKIVDNEVESIRVKESTDPDTLKITQIIQTLTSTWVLIPEPHKNAFHTKIMAFIIKEGLEKSE